MTRIAVLHHSYGRFGGAERLTLSHYWQLKAMKKDVTLFYNGILTDGWRRRLKSHDVRVLPRTSSGIVPLVGLVRELSHYDKILIHHHIDPFVAFYISRFLGKKITWYMGSLFELAWERSITGLDYRSISTTVKSSGIEFYGRLSNVLLSNALYGATVRGSKVIDTSTVRRCAKLITNSAFLADQVQRIYGLRTRPDVVYPGIDPILANLADKAEGGNGSNFMLYVGALIPMKNVSTMINAASTQGAEVVLVGDGQEKENLKLLASRRNVSALFLDNGVDEVALGGVYSSCKFLVNLSLYEPFGLTAVEAGFFGKPSIVTNRGGPTETVVDGRTGFVVNPVETDIVADRMHRLLEDDNLRNEMGSRANRRVRRMFTLDRSTQGLVASLEA
jgi:glycosyltransferase involved in cell wall biosynthesis